MIVNSLPEDCFYEIFKNIKDTETLYNCLVSNRFLCRIIIPFLYQNPFSVVYNFKQYYCLINVYLGCLDDEEIGYLRKHSLEITKKSISIFDYAKYLEIIPDLTYAIECWKIYQLDDFNEDLYYIEYIDQLDDNEISLLQEAILHLFLRKVKNCKKLNIRSNLFDNSLFNLQFFKETIINYSELSSLHLHLINTFNDSLFLDFISLITNNCFYIKKLKITAFDFYDDSTLQELIEILIKNQRNFKNLDLSHPNVFLLNNVSKIIKSQRRSLASIHIRNTMDYINPNIFDSLTMCENIEKLEFVNCNGLNSVALGILNRSSLNLKELIVHYNDFYPYNGLHRLGHSLYNLSLHKVSPFTMHQISKYCLNLKSLKIICNDLVLSSYQQLRNMKIENFTIYLQKSLLFEDNYLCILQRLAENLPESLNSFTIEEKFPKYTNFEDNNYITSKNLENFLNHRKVNLISLNLNFYIKYEIFETIVDYVEKRNSLKYLGIRSPPGTFWFKDSKKNIGKQLLNKIKENKVEIITIRE